MWLNETSDGVILKLIVVPRASRTEVVGLHGVRLKVRLAAPPHDNLANEELLLFLHKILRVPQAYLQLVRGHTAKTKDVIVRNLAASEIRLRPGEQAK